MPKYIKQSHAREGETCHALQYMGTQCLFPSLCGDIHLQKGMWLVKYMNKEKSAVWLDAPFQQTFTEIQGEER